MSVSVLFIGGIDSSGGAGILRDCATATAMAATPRVAVTAVTAQTDHSVTSIHPVPPADVAAQITAAGPVGAVKVGMLCTAQVADAVAEHLPDAPLVLDPVLASSSGHALLDDAGVRCLLFRLLKHTALLTPNHSELRILAKGLGLPDGADERSCVAALMRQGCDGVLVKGGHSGTRWICEDRLYTQSGQIVSFLGPRFPIELRGTGCHLASAIAVCLATGSDMRAAIETAKSLGQARFREAVQII